MITLTHGIARTINVISHSPMVMTALLGSVAIVLFSILSTSCNLIYLPLKLYHILSEFVYFFFAGLQAPR